MKEAYLVLADGHIFRGQAFGAEGETTAELVFNTGAGGFIETITDPAYYGQIVLQTFPVVGIYGIIPEDFVGECRMAGYVVRSACAHPSNFRSRMTLDAFLKEKGVVGIEGVDTREVTRILRDHGTMTARIMDHAPTSSDIPAPVSVTGAVDAVTDSTVKVFEATGTERHHVAVLDLGAVKTLASDLSARGCKVTVLPPHAKAEDILTAGYDAVVLSEGPGDPAENTAIIHEVKGMFGKIPMFALGLGHQILALATGANTEKLPFGHRGANQPVKDLKGSRTYITSQNHGYTVVCDSVKAGKVRYINVNDGSCEGIDYEQEHAFSLQFVPDVCTGVRGSDIFYRRFLTILEGGED